MRNLSVLFSVTLLAGTFTAFAQKDSSGIYTTVEDYRSGHLAYPINYVTDKQKIKDYLFLDATKVKVKHGGETHLLDKNNIYGYRNTKGVDYRFVGNNAYRILSPGEPIILYKYGEPDSDPIKNPPRMMNRYYFSTNESNSPVILTRRNLKAAFPDNTRFHELVDRNFRSDDELTRFNKANNRYTVNILLEESMAQK